MPNSIYNIHNPLGVKYQTRLRTGFTHLKEYNFQASVDAIGSYSSGIEMTFFSLCKLYHSNTNSHWQNNCYRCKDLDWKWR